jgi:uncharacterized protein
MDIRKEFPSGVLQTQLFMGLVSAVSAYSVRINLNDAGNPSGLHYSGYRYGKGEVGEFVLIEGQLSLLLGRLVSVKLPENDRRIVTPQYTGQSLDAFGDIQLLGTVSMSSLEVSAGVDSYPRIGDRVFAAPVSFVSNIPLLMEQKKSKDEQPKVTLKLGSVDVSCEHQSAPVEILPEKLFGRHCAILGTTGGGKSWTTARVIEECLNYGSKLILLDATGEYRGFSGTEIKHVHLGNPPAVALNSTAVSLPPTSFQEPDFLALFEPAGKVQGPKLRAAIRSLRLASRRPDLAPGGVLKKINQPKAPIIAAEQDVTLSRQLEDPRTAFDVTRLVAQLREECCFLDGKKPEFPGRQYPQIADTAVYGGENDADYTYCLSLISRINGVLSSSALACVFAPPKDSCDLCAVIDEFLKSDQKLLRICLSGISFEFDAREIIANAIGRHLLVRARAGALSSNPFVVFVDEAHNFLGKTLGSDEFTTHLDAFELIAKEGRKYGLSLCLATQRPRDITEGVLSQMGTLVVHRLTNDRDREVVERACGEIDKSASAFLPNLRPGEAVIIGADFPIPLTIQISAPTTKPESDGPDFQTAWRREQ